MMPVEPSVPAADSGTGHDAASGSASSIASSIASGAVDVRVDTGNVNVDPGELAKFARQAQRWWDPLGPMASLHAINPLRLNWIDARVGLDGRRVLDAGCGGGLLSEAMALRGATVTAIDAAEEPLDVAARHALHSGVQVDYRHTTAEALAQTPIERFTVVTCMEMLEHVPDPAAVLTALAQLVAPGGHLFLSTLNRTPRAFLEAIVAAEYLFRLLPAGTHDYARFLRPAEIGKVLRQNGLDIVAMRGLTWSPLSRRYSLTERVDVNYLLHAIRRPVEPADTAHATEAVTPQTSPAPAAPAPTPPATPPHAVA
jgi:2-polyprenyl-6-hydroxyphenyl methylase/3-demethylubiquinone-9 3-methyltransferase